MTCKAQHVNPKGGHVNGAGSGGLGRVHNQEQAISFCRSSHLFQVRQATGQIGGVGTDDSRRFRPHQPGQYAVIQCAVRTGGEKVHPHSPLCGQAVQGAQDGVVLPVRGNHPAAGFEQTEKGGVQRLGSIGGKGHLSGLGTAQQGCDFRPDLIHRPGRRQPWGAGSPAAVAQGGHGLYNCLRYAGGLLERGGRIVEIDHGVFSVTASIRICRLSAVRLPGRRPPPPPAPPAVRSSTVRTRRKPQTAGGSAAPVPGGPRRRTPSP